jgi:hypothetical protein
MQCRSCLADVRPDEIKIDADAEEDGIEVGYTCPHCALDHYAVLKPHHFEVVD